MWSAVSGCTWCPHFPAQTVPVGTNSSHVASDVVNVSDILRTSLLSKLPDPHPLSCALFRCCPDSVSHLSSSVQPFQFMNRSHVLSFRLTWRGISGNLLWAAFVCLDVMVAQVPFLHPFYCVAAKGGVGSIREEKLR